MNYDQLAKEYYNNSKKMLKSQRVVLKPFIDLLKPKAKVLDVGCGVGLDIKILNESEKDFKVTGIDTSELMLRFAGENRAKLSKKDFFDFKGSCFNGVIMDAFIHLFPKPKRVFDKLKEVLLPDGYCLLTTTLHDIPIEGYMVKSGYKKKMFRFRKFYSEKSLIELVEDNGFDIVYRYYDYNRMQDKTWINLIIKMDMFDIELSEELEEMKNGL